MASPSANTRTTAVTGIVLGVIPLLSLIGLILSVIAFVGYRRASAKPTLAVVGMVVSGLVLIASWVYFVSALTS